jgi:hypothetical protein
MNALCDNPLVQLRAAEAEPPAGTRVALLAALPGPAATRADGVLEALLPTVRAMAMLLAARRMDWNGAAPAQLADEADWMAARILALQLAEVNVTLESLPLVETANRRLADFAAALGFAHVPAAPALVAAQAGGVLQARSRLPLAAELAPASLVERSVQVAARCVQQLPSALRRVLGLA